jgi:hypothetical protein
MALVETAQIKDRRVSMGYSRALVKCVTLPPAPLYMMPYFSLLLRCNLEESPPWWQFIHCHAGARAAGPEQQLLSRVQWLAQAAHCPVADLALLVTNDCFLCLYEALKHTANYIYSSL